MSTSNQSSPAPGDAPQQPTPTVVAVPAPIPSQSQQDSATTSPVPSKSSTPDITHARTRFNETVIANRIFVGGITYDTNDIALKEFFSKFGHVREAKIISDRAGVSKGYGFITFETPEEATRIIKENANNLYFRDKKLNIAEAVKRQQTYPKHTMEPMPISNGTVIQSPQGYTYQCTYQNGMVYFDHLVNTMSPHHPPPPASMYQPYPIPYVMPAPPPSPQYLPAPTQGPPQYSTPSYPPQPPPNTPHWNTPGGQFRFIQPPQSPPVATHMGMMMYPPPLPGPSEFMYQPNPYHQPEITELPMDMIAGQAENAIIPAGMDQHAAVNRSYIAEPSYQETVNLIPRGNNLKMTGPKKPPFVNRGRPMRTQIRNPKPGMNSAGFTILAKDEMKTDSGVTMVTSPPEK